MICLPLWGRWQSEGLTDEVPGRSRTIHTEILSKCIRIKSVAYRLLFDSRLSCASRMGYVGDFIPKPLTRDFAP